MHADLMMLWRNLSARLRHDPEILALRIDHLEGRVTTLEQVPHDQQAMVETPLGKIPVQIALIVVLALLIVRPELGSAIISKFLP